MPLLTEWDLKLLPDDVLRAQGAEPEQARQRRPMLWELAVWAVQESSPLLQPQVLYQEFTIRALRHYRFELEESGADTQDRLSLSGDIVTEHLIGAQSVVVMLCTIGNTLEDIVDLVIREEPLRGLALDAAGSAAVELLATFASHHFESQAHLQGWQTSIPLTPGMIGWSVQQGQPQIFNLLARELKRQPGFKVRLTESYMMQPRKTISQILGMGQTMKPQGRICDYCTLQQTCRYQKQTKIHER